MSAEKRITGSSVGTSAALPTLTVVLDMDELLIHAYHVMATSKKSGQSNVLLQLKPPKRKSIRCYGVVATKEQGDIELKVKFVKRPGLDEFFEALAKEPVDVYIWTASEQMYADTILEEILPPSLKSIPRLYRSDCKVATRKDGKEIYYKDLSKNWAEKDLARIILFDDNGKNFLTCPQNGIECLKWLGNLVDEPGEPEYLQSVLDVIRQLIPAPDVREVAKKMEQELKEAAEDAQPCEQITFRQSLVMTVSQSFFGKP